MLKKLFSLQIIYFIILQCNCKPLSEELISATISKDDEVNQEVSYFVKLLNDLENTEDEKERCRVSGKLEEGIKQIIKRAIRAENKADQHLRKETRLEIEKDKTDMYQLLLAITFRVDTLEKILVPGYDFKGQQRSKRWAYIFNMKTPATEDIRKKILAAGMTETSFSEQVERLIQERNSRAGYANVPLPRLVKKKTIEGALQIMEITDDEKAIETLKILIQPVNGLDFTTSTSPEPEK